MARTRRSLLGAVGGAILVAGCVGDDDATEDGTDGDTPAPSDGTDGTESEDVSDGSDGEDGSDGGSGSSGGDGSENQDGDDGGAGDSGEGGDEQSATLAVQVIEHETYGEILAGPDGRTLYMFDSDDQGAGESTCYEGCAENWPPLTVEGEAMAGENVTGELTTFERDDGTMQVAVGGWPLYYFASDESEGDTEGQGVNDVWWVLDPDGMPIRGEPDTGGGNGGGYPDLTADF